MKMLKNRIFYMDFIRAVAMCMILIFHFLTEIELHQLLLNPDAFKIGGVSLLNLGGVNLTLGNYGVSLFFIISGAGLMYAYRDKLSVKEFYKKRVLTIYPLYYITFIAASLTWLLAGYKLSQRAPLWTLLLTILGVDGWLSEVIPTYALVGDWFVGCIVCIYLLFPLLHKCMNRCPRITLGIYLLIFLFWEYVYPFGFSKRSSVVLRTFEVLLGMYFVKMNKKVSWKGALVSFLLFGIIFAVRIRVISLYILVPIAGMSLFMILNYIAEKIDNLKIQKITIWLSYYSFPIFLIHHFLLNMILGQLSQKSLGLGGALVLFVVYVIIVVGLGVAVKKIEKIIERKR